MGTRIKEGSWFVTTPCSLDSSCNQTDSWSVLYEAKMAERTCKKTHNLVQLSTVPPYISLQH